MNRFSRVIASVGCTFLLCCGATKAQETVTPKLEPPQRLAPYTDVTRALATAKEIIHLLSTAKFESDAPDYFTSDCNTSRNHSIVRGYELAKTAYYLLGSKMEIGWYDAAYDSLALSEPYRGVLAVTWTPEIILQAISAFSELRDLPSTVRADLRSFLSELLKYRKYESFLQRSPDDLRLINERIEETCSINKSRLLEALQKGEAYDWKRERNIDKFTAQSDLDICRKRAIGSSKDIAKAYRELINASRDPDSPELDHCLDGQFNYYNTLILGAAGGIRKQSTMSPNYFLIGFWMRRRAEGSERLAEFVIERAIEALKD